MFFEFFGTLSFVEHGVIFSGDRAIYSARGVIFSNGQAIYSARGVIFSGDRAIYSEHAVIFSNGQAENSRELGAYQKLIILIQSQAYKDKLKPSISVSNKE